MGRKQFKDSSNLKKVVQIYIEQKYIPTDLNKLDALKEKLIEFIKKESLVNFIKNETL